MKKLLALMLALIMLMCFAACGGKDKNTGGNTDSPKGDNGDEGNNGTGTAVGDINAENWAEVVSANFGLELTLPDGWSVAQAKSPNGFNNVDLFFTVGGDETYATFGEKIFAELKADATGDIFKYGSNDILYSTFEEASGGGTIVSMAGKVNDGKKTLVVNYFDNGTNVELTLLLF